MYVCMYVFMYVYVYVYMYVCMYVNMYTCMSVCKYVYMYVCMYVCQYQISGKWKIEYWTENEPNTLWKVMGQFDTLVIWLQGSHTLNPSFE